MSQTGENETQNTEKRCIYCKNTKPAAGFVPRTNCCIDCSRQKARENWRAKHGSQPRIYRPATVTCWRDMAPEMRQIITRFFTSDDCYCPAPYVKLCALLGVESSPVNRSKLWTAVHKHVLKGPNPGETPAA